MELATPHKPVKPPIAVKPKQRAAPPLPPKHFLSDSPSALLSPATSAQDASVPKISPRLSPTTQVSASSSAGSVASDLGVSGETNSNESLSSASSNVSPRNSSAMLLSPARFYKKGALFPSSTFSLPASFRNGLKGPDLHSSSSSLPHSNSVLLAQPTSFQKSPIKHVSPPRRRRLSLGQEEPKDPCTATSKKDADFSTDGGSLLSNDRTLNLENDIINQDASVLSGSKEFSQRSPPLLPSYQPSSLSLSQPDKPSPPSSSDSEPHKTMSPPTSLPPPRRPAPPPNSLSSSHKPKSTRTPLSAPQRPSSPPSRGHPGQKPSAEVTDQATSTEISTSLPTTNKDSFATDIKPTSVPKHLPPPLPKNPPRGGVPRKPRQGSQSLSPQSEPPTREAPRVEIQQPLEAECPAQGGHPNTRENSRGESEKTVLDSLQSNNGNCDDVEGENHQHTVSPSKGEALNINDKEGSIQPTDTNNAAVPPPKKAPKPRPRTRPSIVSLKEDDTKIPDSIFTIGNKDSSHTTEGQASLPASIANEEPGLRKEVELDYAQVYQSKSDVSRSDSTHLSRKQACPTSADGPTVETRKISAGEADSWVSREPDLSSTIDSNAGACPSAVTSYEFLQEEPETTCGMLKEIEELLKSKLKDIDLNLDTPSAVNSFGNRRSCESTDRHSSDETMELPQDLNVEAQNSSRSTSPVRPPRPKRQAVLFKHLGSLESLTTSLENLSPDCGDPSPLNNSVGSHSGKKVIPKKPKRTFMSRINRSHSDVTGMKAVADSNSPEEESAPPLPHSASKPFLPPRSESLRRCELSLYSTSPPPLPPRNKLPPCLSDAPDAHGSPLTSGDTSCELPGSTVAINKDVSEITSAQFPETPQNLRYVEARGSGTLERKSSPSKPRPTRKAPPPPTTAPARSLTFSSADNRRVTESQSDPSQVCSSATVSRSKSSISRRPNSGTEDHEYHEIADTIKLKREMSQEKEDPQAPVLPSRTLPSNSSSSQTSLSSLTSNAQNSSTILSTNETKCAISLSGESVPLPAEKFGTVPNHRKHKHAGKFAKSVLIQNMTQGLGLGKSQMPNRRAASSTTTAGYLSQSNPTANTENMSPKLDKGIHDRERSSASVEEISSESNTLHHCEDPDKLMEGQVSGLENMEEIVSSGTDTEPEEDEEEIYSIRKAKKVFFIAKEIMSSESTFVDVLKLLNLDFRLYISKVTEDLGHCVIPTETLNKILDFLPQLQNFNEDLLKDLTDRIDNWEKNPRLGDIFVKKGPFLKLYSSYIRNFENATAALDDAVRKNPSFALALKDFEMSSRCARLALKHYMLKPIQRIPQYKLLLQDYLKHLTEASPDYKDTVTALGIVSEVAGHANDSMRHGDNVQRLLEVQRSLIGQFEVIQPGRILIKKGELLKLSRKEMQPRMFFLFNDVLLYTTPNASGFKINNILSLSGMKIISPKLEDYRFEFNIISVQRSFTLSASSSEEKEAWTGALQTAIDENTKKHHTFQTIKPGPQVQTSLLDKDFVLGHKAPLWVPDARVTMCMLCLLEFTLTWRRHHCRSCGRVVCSHCSKNRAPLRYLKYEPARVCDQCFEKLKADMAREFQLNQVSRPNLSQSEEDSVTSVSEGTGEESTDASVSEEADGNPVKHDSGLSLHNLMARFQKIRISGREKRKPNNFRPSVLKEVRANDEGSDMSGYLRIYRSRKWKRLWFVVKGKVLYTYKASEDMAATESMPLLGYEVTRMNSWFEGAESDLLFELSHQNKQPITTRKEGERKINSYFGLGLDKTTQRLIFRTDSTAATSKWVNVLKEASET